MLDLTSDINFHLQFLINWFASHKMLISNESKILFPSFGLSPCKDVKVIVHEAQCMRFKITNISSNHLCDSIFLKKKELCDQCFKIEILWIIRKLKLVILLLIPKAISIFSNEGVIPPATTFSMKTLLNVYNGINESRLQYGLACWSCTYNNTIMGTKILQKKAIRRISSNNRLDHTFPLSRYLNILPLRNLYYYKVVTFFKIFFVVDT